jgi:hypothetical protein
MLTTWVANRVSLTLQSIAKLRLQGTQFGGNQILFVGDLLQLPPVVRNFAMPVVHRLITHLSYWPEIRKFLLKRPMRAPDAHWNHFLQATAM